MNSHLDASSGDGASVAVADAALVHIHDVAFVDAVDVILVHIVGGAFEAFVNVNAYLEYSFDESIKLHTNFQMHQLLTCFIGFNAVFWVHARH